MKGFGTTISEMAKALRDTQMETPTLGSSNMGEHTVKASILGRTEKSTMANGTKASSRATVFGRESRETHISENGKTRKHMDTVCIHGRMEIAMKASGICA
jgi:hypothetical protein